MGIVSVLLLVVLVISALIIILLVMIQDEQGEGLGGIFGGGSSTPFGSRSGNVLTKFTSILGAVFLVCSFALAWINRTPESGDVIGAARRQGLTEQQTEWWNPDAEAEPLPEAEADENTLQAPPAQEEQAEAPATEEETAESDE
jgi:preprotein translocase subunit SecG